MSTPQPRSVAHAAVMPATVTAGVACVISALGAVEGVRLYTSHNAARCGGGLGWIGPGLGLFGTLAIALLITLIALVTTLIVAFARHRWLWIIALFLVIALAVLVVINSASQASHDLVGTIFGFGCSWFYSDVVLSLVPLLVAAPTLAFLLVERRHQDRV